MNWLDDLVEGTEEGDVCFWVHVQPASGRTRILGKHGEAIKISVAAPPQAGRANAELIEYIAECLGKAPDDVSIESGQKNRKKRLRVKNLDRLLAVKLMSSEAARRRPGR